MKEEGLPFITTETDDWEQERENTDCPPTVLFFYANLWLDYEAIKTELCSFFAGIVRLTSVPVTTPADDDSSV